MILPCQTLHTLQQCISDTVVKYFSVPLDLHMMVFASVTAGRLSKLCFCVLTCIQLDMDQNKFILPFYHYN